MSRNTSNSRRAASAIPGLASMVSCVTRSRREHSPEPGEASEFEPDTVLQEPIGEDDPDNVHSENADEPTIVLGEQIFEEAPDAEAAHGSPSRDHSKNPDHQFNPRDNFIPDDFTLGDQSSFGHGGARPRLSSALQSPGTLLLLAV